MSDPARGRGCIPSRDERARVFNPVCASCGLALQQPDESVIRAQAHICATCAKDPVKLRRVMNDFNSVTLGRPRRVS